MRKHSIFSRVLSLLLVFAMALSFVPASAFAAYYYEVDIGDIAGEYIDANGVTSDHTGKTGLQSNIIDTSDTISWPIRIYDYLNDGMLFEYANASYTGDIPDGQGGAYGGGTPAPHFTGAQTVIGNDYTLKSTFNEYAYTYLGSTSVYAHALDTSSEGAKEVNYSRAEAKNFVEPNHLHLEYVLNQDDDNTKSYVWISNFARDNYTYYKGNDIRYAVIVYRTNDAYPGRYARFFWATSNDSYSRDFSYHNEAIDISNLDDKENNYGKLYTDYFAISKSSDWTYAVVDMKQSTIASKWSDIDDVERVAGIGFGFPLGAVGEEMDVTHIAYFGTAFEAEQFGMDAVAFAKDPGEYLDSHIEYTSGPIEVPVAKPTPSGNVIDFTIPSGSTGTSSFGYAYDSGYDQDVYKTWTTVDSGKSYIGGLTVTGGGSGNRTYVNLANGTGKDKGIYIWSYSATNKSAVRYVTVVYRTNGFTANDNVACFIESPYSPYGAGLDTSAINGTYAARQTMNRSEGKWSYFVYDLNNIATKDGDYNSITYLNKVGLYLPDALSTSKTMDIAFVDCYSDPTKATAFGAAAASFMNGETTTQSGSSYTTTQKKWNTGNSVAYSLLFANQGGGWTDNGTYRGGNNAYENGYFSYEIGKHLGTGADDTAINADRNTAKTNGYPVSDQIYLLSSYPYDMSQLDMGGYKLFNTFESGILTAGLLESGITTISAGGKSYRVPQYKEETIEYIAYLLRDSLCVGKTDSSGNYNYNFVQGTRNGEQYGYDADGNPYDLASALRAQLGITLPANGGSCTSVTTSVGDYADMTDAQKKALIGPYLSCKDNINTFVDAAYYLLMNLYIDNSYNQPQDEYKYLVLSAATLSDGRTGYVFDGGFTTGVASQTANTDAYRNSSESATVYDKSKQSIYQKSANSKDQVYFSGIQRTTRFPFLPITDSTGVYAGETKSPYFLDDGNGVMGVTEEGATFVNRNYNYAIASNGEFIYYEEDNLYFDFEGDDDVYLFINGELVVDVGAAHSVTTVTMNVKDYVDWSKGVLANLSGYDPSMTNREMENLLDSMNLTDAKKAEYLRAHRLNLQDGEICQFDFYYMERHGWGANCRIASNIRVTEPAMRVEKHAYQGGDEIAYSDVIVASDPVEYNFKMINNGSSKLFNLTFTDSTIGVTLEYSNGLTVADKLNGVYVFDANGGTLEASDITALVTGWMPVETGGTHIKDIDGNYVEDANGTHVYVTVENTFKTQQELKNFLAYLQGEGMDNTELNTSYQQQGYGLWVDADVTFKGIYYKLSVEQVEVGVLDNTVYVTATSMPNPQSSGNQILQSQARHRVYVTGLPYYYQWAGHNLYLPMDDIMEDTIEAAKDSGNQAHEYESFLNSIQDKSYNYALCDKFGVVKTYQEVVHNSSKTGYIVNFPTAGTHCFYLLVSTETIDSTTKAADLTKGKYAIIRITVFAADVEDSYYVLDYGLSTEDLGTNGELFKNDYLFGGSSDNSAKMMGIAMDEPAYLSYPEQTANYNRIQFTPVTDTNSIPVGDGYYTMLKPSDEDYRKISFNSYTGEYSLTEVGTVKINVYTPTDWTNAYLYFWYDGGSNNGWPGDTMTRITAGQYTLDIPADVAHVIISNGSMQTGNLLVTPGMENTIVVSNPTTEGAQYLDADVKTFVPVSMTVTVPDGWGDVYVYSFNSKTNQSNGSWPGFKMDPAEDGTYTHNVPGSYDRVVINNGNGNGKQTTDLVVTPGADLRIDVTQKTDNSTSDVTVVVPDTWEEVYLYCWSSANDANKNANWPGVKLTADSNGVYRSTVSADFDRMIVNNNSGTQTDDLSVTTGKNIAIEVKEDKSAHITTSDYSGTIEAYSAVVKTYTLYVKAPESWKNVHLHAWNSNGYPVKSWPGIKLTTTTEDGRYAVQLPVDTAYVVVNNGEGSYQTVDLAVKNGVEATVTVTNPGADGKYLASIDYNDDFTFTPSDFMDSTYSIWMAITVHNKSLENPTALNNAIDVTQEVQLYKKIAVLPATVVYYEDDFPAITYVQDSGNVFTEIGSSSDLTQSVDQSQEYGQDDAYQNNSDMSGDSLHRIEILYSDEVLVKIPTEWVDADPHINYYDKEKNLISLPLQEVATSSNTYSVTLPQMIFDVFISHDEIARHVEVSVPSSWNNAYISYTDQFTETFHCEMMTQKVSGAYTWQLPSYVQSVMLTSYKINSVEDIQNVIINVPADWVDAYISYEVGENKTMTTFQLTKNADGTYSCHVPNGISNIIISEHDLGLDGTIMNGEPLNIRKTGPVGVVYGCINNISVYEQTYITTDYENISKDNTTSGDSQNDDPNVVVNVPDEWENAYISYEVGEDKTMTSFKLDKSTDGTYSHRVPDNVGSIILSERNLDDEDLYINDKPLVVRKTKPISIVKNRKYTITVDQLVIHAKDRQTYIHSLYDPGFTTYIQIPASGNVTSTGESLEIPTTDKIRITRGYQNTIDATNADDIKVTSLSGLVASFQFTGTGFELIGRTNADDSATIVVEVLDSSNTVIKRIPVITQFDNNETGNAPGGDESIYQVPVIRVDGLTKGEYTVKIKGIPSRSREHTYLYLDGIRIFQPLGPTNEHYNEAENNATFAEIRDLIVTGKAAVAKYDGNSMSVSSGTITWTENLTGMDITGVQEFKGNQVDNVDAYLMKGPNNEVYMNGTIENAALVFTVKKTSGTPALQIAVRAIDEVQFYIGANAAPTNLTSGMNAVIEFYAKQTDGSFAWEPLVTVTSGTEQYYTIDIDRCFTADGEILVAVQVKSGMASFTSLKYNNLEITDTVGGEVATYKYINGELAVCTCYSKCTDKNDGIRWACVLCSSVDDSCESEDVCTCTTKCVAGNANENCSICYEHKNYGCEAECTCTSKCTEDAHNAECAVCKSNFADCGVPVCNCTTKCTDEKRNDECSICRDNIADCIVSEKSGTVTTEEETSPSIKQSGIQLPYLSYMMSRPSLSDTTTAPDSEAQPEDKQPEQTPGTEPEVDPGTTPEVDSGTQPEEKPAEKPNDNSGANKPNNSGNKPSNNDIAAQVAAKIAAIQNKVSALRNQMTSFVGEFNALFR